MLLSPSSSTQRADEAGTGEWEICDPFPRHRERGLGAERCCVRWQWGRVPGSPSPSDGVSTQLPGFPIRGVKLPTKEVCLGGSRREPTPAAPSARPFKEGISL